jgi:hypothetical protein
MTARTVVARPVAFARAAVIVFVVLRLILAVFTPPIGDEAYYWMWGQKLAWSYFDHPPLHAWLLRLMDLLFGWNLFSLRILTWVSLAGILGIFWLWAKRLKPDDPAAWFWPSAAIYLATPVFLWTGSISFHDHLLTVLCLASGHCFLVFAERWESDGSGYRWLYAGAVLLGLAVLTKYNGVLLGFAVAAFFAVRRPLRPLFRSPHTYLAAILSVAMQAPVFWWNATEGFASYTFHLSERWGGNVFTFRPMGVVNFLVVTLLTLSPFLVPPIIRLIRQPGTVSTAGATADFAARARQLALCALVISTLTMVFLSFFISVLFYWNIVAFILVMPLLAGWIRWRWLLVAHAVYGAILAIPYLLHVVAFPLNDWTIQSTFGWDEVGARVRALEAEHGTTFIVATRYTTAAQLGFALHDPEVTAIADRHDQYDFWFAPPAHEGQDAIIVSDEHLGLTGVTPYFDSVTPLETLDVKRFGNIVYRPSLYLGHNFHAVPTQ